MITQEDMPYTKEEVEAMVKTIQQLRKEKQELIDKACEWVEPNVGLTDFASALFTAFSDAWQQYLGGEEVNVAQWAKEHSTELLEVARKEHVEWSEEDEYVYNEILKRVADKKLYEHDLEYIYKWLKSLKPQPQWKPSDRQMQALEYHLHSTYNKSWQYKETLELYNDLKKLKW